jgi:hypothetical protein
MRTAAGAQEVRERASRTFRGNRDLKQATGTADAVRMERSGIMLRRTGALAIAALAASDLLYRLLLRESLRRALGMGEQQIVRRP